MLDKKIYSRDIVNNSKRDIGDNNQEKRAYTSSVAMVHKQRSQEWVDEHLNSETYLLIVGMRTGSGTGFLPATIFIVIVNQWFWKEIITYDLLQNVFFHSITTYWHHNLLASPPMRSTYGSPLEPVELR